LGKESIACHLQIEGKCEDEDEIISLSQNSKLTFIKKTSVEFNGKSLSDPHGKRKARKNLNKPARAFVLLAKQAR
jgi:hypothetical protein